MLPQTLKHLLCINFLSFNETRILQTHIESFGVTNDLDPGMSRPVTVPRLWKFEGVTSGPPGPGSDI